MKQIDLFTPEKDTFQHIIKTSQMGIWDGKELTGYFEACKWYLQKYECIVIFMRESGYHSGGWWKNPDYERCYHLSISFPGGRNRKTLLKILDLLFGYNKKLLWQESAYSDIGKQNEVMHFRLFCDQSWKAIQPRGEVYSTHFTEHGWKSFSEVNQ